MRAIVTGCAGFIGSHLTERMLAEGWDVVGIDAFTDYYDPSDKEANLSGCIGHPSFELVRHDLAEAPLGDLLGDRPMIVHLAAQPGVRGSFGDGFARYVHDNVLATQRVFEAALEAGCRRVVYASSSSVYGDALAYPCNEEGTPIRPRSPYGVTKHTCEDLADVYRGFGLQTVGLRYFTVYGPRQRPDMAMRLLCEAAAGGAAFRLYGDGGQSRDFTHVADAVDVTLRAALFEGDPGSLFNVGGGVEATMNEVIEIVGALAGHPVPLVRGPVQRGDVRRTGADTTRARSVLGWTPSVGLVDGLRSEWTWVTSRLSPGDAVIGPSA